MNLQEKVCTIEQSKRLVEHGIDSISMASYVEIDSVSLHITETARKMLKYSAKRFGEDSRMVLFPAWDVAELGLMLPEMSYTAYCEETKGWIARCDMPNDNIELDGYYETEAICRAELMLYLLDENLITVNTTN